MNKGRILHLPGGTGTRKLLNIYPSKLTHFCFSLSISSSSAPRRKTDLPLQSGYMSDAAALMANAPSKYTNTTWRAAKFSKRMQFLVLIFFFLCLSFALLPLLSCSFSVRCPLFCVMIMECPHYYSNCSHCNVIFRHFQGPLCGSLN